MFGIHFMGKVPFRTVYLTSIVTDENGDKMSKTKGNVIDPLDVIDEFGADAVRFTLAIFTSGRDIPLAKSRMQGYAAFANKIWNASRFALMHIDTPLRAAKPIERDDLKTVERWILSRLNKATRDVNKALSAFRFDEASNTIYQFFWHQFCDWYIEMVKPVLLGRHGSPDDAARARRVLLEVLDRSLRLLHPFMPFITEEIWQRLPHEGDSIMIAPYPKVARRRVDASAEREMGVVMGVVTAIRNIRGEMRVAPGVTLSAIVRPGPEAPAALVRANAPLIQTLARAAVTVDSNASRPRNSALGVVGDIEVYVALEGVVDLGAERQRLEKEIKRADDAIAFGRAKLARPEFAERAPAEIVDKEREKVAQQEALREKLVASLSWVG
jgi:valyl-tRNA synthetase